MDLETAQGKSGNGSGAAYVTGHTFSPDFPTTPGAYDTTDPGAYGTTGRVEYDVFVVKISAAGDALVYATCHPKPDPNSDPRPDSDSDSNPNPNSGYLQ